MSTIEETSRLVDDYIRKRTERLLAAKVAEKLEEEEKALKKQLLQIAIDGKAKSLGGTLGTLNYSRVNKPTVTDWEALYAYIKEFGAFELLQKRIGEKAVEERWEDDIVVPGVGTFPVDNFTISGKV